MADHIHNRILGCLAGGAVADAVGYEVEFDSLATIMEARPYGVTGPRHEGRIVASDDTQMTLFTCEGLSRSLRAGRAGPGDVIADINSAYLDWLWTQLDPAGRRAGPGRAKRVPVGSLALSEAMQVRRAPGNTCLSALMAGGAGTPGTPVNDSCGCGGVMRSAPLGLFPAWSAEEAFEAGMLSGALTHGHPMGYISAGTMSAAVRLLLDGLPLREALLGAAELARRHPDGSQMSGLLTEAVVLAEGPELPMGKITEILGEGWTGHDAMAVGAYAALSGEDFQDAVCIAATHSGDSDSTASIAGQLLGARDGFACVPFRWWECLDIRQQVADAADRLYAAASAA